MASPQLENGYIRIANEITQQLVKTPLLGAEFQIILFVISKTYGFNKKKDWISLTQFENGTGLSRPTVVKALKNLVIKNLLIKSEKFEFTFNKDWEKWVVNPPLLVKCSNRTGKPALTKIGKPALTHKRHNTNTKDNTDSKESGDNKKNMKTLNYETGEYEEEKPKSHKREDIIKLANLFDKMARDYSKKPIKTTGSYFIVQRAMKTHGLKPKGIIKLYQDWFNDPKIEMENKINMTWCLGKVNINKFKLKN